MKMSGLLSGGAPIVKKYQISADVDDIGIPLLAVASAEAGLNMPSATAVNDMVGINLDTGTYLTAQQADGSDPATLVSVIINPDIILEIPMSWGSTEDTDLTNRVVTSGSTTGLVVTTGDDFSSPTLDEGVVWCEKGANAGQFRKITSVSSSAATVTVAFQNDIAVGDEFGYAPIFPMANHTVTLTDAFQQFDASAAVAANTAELQCIALEVNDFLGGNRRPFALFVPQDHILNRES